MSDHPVWILLALFGGLIGFSVALDWLRERQKRKAQGEVESVESVEREASR